MMRKIKPEKSQNIPSEVSKEEIYPYFSIDLKHLPEAKEWEPGETYNIGLEVKMTGINIREDEEKERGDANFNVTGIEILKKPKKKETKKPIKRY